MTAQTPPRSPGRALRTVVVPDDLDELLTLWPQLYLPPYVRQAWERRHPQLAHAGARPHAPQ